MAKKKVKVKEVKKIDYNKQFRNILIFLGVLLLVFMIVYFKGNKYL